MVIRALQEDIGSGDLTAQLIDPSLQGKALVVCKEPAVICGTTWFEQSFKLLDQSAEIQWTVQDGDTVIPMQVLCTLSGTAQTLLTGERTALNFLQMLSATATRTSTYVDVIADTQAHILDTRKTLPGLRVAQKYAVRCGGGLNHRMGLFDAILIKENHIHAAGSIKAAVTRARQLQTNNTITVEVETETLDEVREAIEIGADIIMLDDFSLNTLREAVALVNGQAKIEASGGINLDNIRAIAEAGVDFISVGSLTKDIRAIDLSMRFDYATP